MNLAEQWLWGGFGFYLMITWWIIPMLQQRPMTIRYEGRIRAVRAIQNEVKRGRC